MAVRQQASTGELVDDGKQSASTIDGKPAMHVRIYSPFKVYFDQMAFSLSGQNGTGPFDILPRHHNFISLLLPCELVVRPPTGDVKVKISGGIMHVRANDVTVFLDV